MKRLVLLLLAAMLLGTGWMKTDARAEAPEMRISISAEILLPGEYAVIAFTVPEDGTCRIRLEDGDGNPVFAVAEDRPAQAGYNAMYWNGTRDGVAAPQGAWRLVLEMNGQTAETAAVIGAMIPCLIAPSLETEETQTGKNVTVFYCATEGGTLTLAADSGAAARTLVQVRAETGDGDFTFPAELPAGEHTLYLTLTRDDGTASAPAELRLRVSEPGTKFTPLSGGEEKRTDLSLNGWTVPMDITDEDAVWQALTAPVTVLDDGKGKAQKRQLVIRKEPDEESEGVGVVTLASQGVYVLERGGEWSLIECYSSSFYDSAVLNWNALVRGYVPTAYLKEVVPNQEMGLVADKLTQRLYVFREGRLYSTLLISTGLANERQPYNETRSGEYLLVSLVGGFYSDNMYCPRAIRFNDGDMIHEVPYVVTRDGIIDYSGTEPKLGSRASHGCIRVQRKANPEGLNQEWLFSHYKENTKLLVWEDWQGRQIRIPADDEVYWYNPRKKDYYHCSDRCSALGTRSPQEITYAELSAEDSRLRVCPYCGPTPKKGRLEEINAVYAPGGDHDPVITEARKDCPRPLKKEK